MFYRYCLKIRPSVLRRKSSAFSTVDGIRLAAVVQVVIEGMDGGRLAFFPQLFIACLAGLCTPYVHIFSLLVDLLSQVGIPYVPTVLLSFVA